MFNRAKLSVNEIFRLPILFTLNDKEDSFAPDGLSQVRCIIHYEENEKNPVILKNASRKNQNINTYTF